MLRRKALDQIAALPLAAVLSLSACATPGTDSDALVAKSDRMESSAGYGVAATVASLAYAPFKLVYAIGGTATGGLAWLFSGGDVELAQRLIEPAVCGEYVVPSEALLEPRRIEFFGSCGDDAGDGGDRSAVAGYAPGRLPAVSAAGPGAGCASQFGQFDANVVFEIDRAELDSRAKSELDALAREFERCDGMRMHVEGHADSTGTGELNMSLSKRRAAAVRSYLLSRGVAPERVTTAGYGVARPAPADDAPRSARSNSRRTHTRLRSY